MPMPRSFTVHVRYDEEAKVWFVDESDVPGLATHAESVEALIAKLREMIPELLELNRHKFDDGDLRDVPFEVVAQYSEKLRPVG